MLLSYPFCTQSIFLFVLPDFSWKWLSRETRKPPCLEWIPRKIAHVIRTGSGCSVIIFISFAKLSQCILKTHYAQGSMLPWDQATQPRLPDSGAHGSEDRIYLLLFGAAGMTRRQILFLESPNHHLEKSQKESGSTCAYCNMIEK